MAETDGSAVGATGGRVMQGALSVARFIIGSLILFSMALNCANVVGRHIFLSPIIWAEETMVFIMVWLVFIGAFLVSWDGRHLKMDLLSATLPERWKRILNLISTTLFVLVCGFVVIQSYPVTALMNRFGQKSVVAGFPMVIPHAAVTLGFALMVIAVAIRFRAHVSGTLVTELDELVDEYGDEAGDGENGTGAVA